MKKLLLLLSLSLGCFVLSSCSSEVKKYVIKGHVDKYESDLLMTMVNETGKVDTIHEVRSVNGDFEMEGVINGPKLAFLTIKGVNGRIPLLLEDTLFTLNIRAKDLADVRNYDIQGGRLQAGKNALDDVEIEVFSDRDSILACYFEAEKNHDIAGKMHERAMLDRMTIAYDKEENKFIEANKDNILGLEEFVRNIYIPQVNKDGIIPQDDTFLSKKELPDIDKYKNSQVKQSVLLDYTRDQVVDTQAIKQADVVMLLNLFPQLYSPDIVKKNVLFYEKRTLHDSSLSYCAHAQACANIGELDMAENFFKKALEVDLVDNPYDSTDGLHAAAMGGIYNCLIQGFAGVSADDSALYITPHLPKEWKKMEFVVMYKGCTSYPLCISINNNIMTMEANQQQLSA